MLAFAGLERTGTGRGIFRATSLRPGIALMPSHEPSLPTSNDLQNVVAEMLKKAQRRGASAAEASIGRGVGMSVTVRMGDVETVEHNRDKGLGLTVYIGQRKGSASTSDFSPAALDDTVETAWQIASHGGTDDCAGLADPEHMAHTYPDLDLHHPWSLEADAAIDLALAAENAARGTDARITNSEGASVGTHASERVYGNTHGFIGAYATTRHSLSSVVIAEQDGAMQRDYWYTSARLPSELEAPDVVGVRSAERAVRRLGGRQVPTAKVPVLYSAEISSGLVGHLIGAISGGSVYRKASFLVDHLGKSVFPADVRISEHPLMARAMGSAPFDAEGVATRSRDLVSGGVLESYVLSSYSARKLGLVTTGNAGGVRNVTITKGSEDAPDLATLLKTMGTGLYVTELIGMGVNTVTGDYSRGASGFWVENGELIHPVEEITIAGNLRDMFLGIAAVGGDVDRRGNIHSGSILIEEMTLAGQ